MKKNEEVTVEVPAAQSVKVRQAGEIFESAFLKSQTPVETLHNMLFDAFAEDDVLWLSVLLAKSNYPAHAQNQLVASFRSNPRYNVSAISPFRITKKFFK